MSKNPEPGPDQDPPDADSAPDVPDASDTPDTKTSRPSKDETVRPWYRRPTYIIGLVVLLLVFLIILPPVVAQEVPVGLDEEGQSNAEAGGWQEEEGDGATRMLAGLVLVDPVTLSREDNGIPTGVYVYTTVKVPAMLPKAVMDGQMHDNAIEMLDENGVGIDPASHRSEDYDGNGHDGKINYYKATAESEDFFELGSEVDLFIATWRCSLLGSFAVAVGAAPEGLVEGDDGGVIDPVLVQQANGDSRSGLDQIERDLLAHTKCTR